MMLCVWRYPHFNLIIKYIFEYRYLICNVTAGIFRKKHVMSTLYLNCSQQTLGSYQVISL